MTQAVPANFLRGLPHDFVPLKGEIVKMELLSQVGQTTWVCFPKEGAEYPVW